MCNKRDYSDRVTVLYGHNMANGSMFATLHRFYDADFFNQNRYIYVYTPERNTELTTDDKILVLSTCLNSGDGRYLVQGVLKKDEPTK